MTHIYNASNEQAKTARGRQFSLGFKSAVLGASLLILSACATTTPYQEATKPGAFNGYTETLIEDDRARVSFGGNSLTDRETVENYLLFRAAELSKERGFEHFTLVEQDTERKTRLRSTGSSFNHGFGSPFFRYNFIGAGGRRFSRFGGFGGRGFGGRGFGGRGFGSRGFGGGFNNFDVREITQYRAMAEVKFGRGATPDDLRSFNTEQVLRNLGPTIVYPDAENDQVVSPEVSSDNI